MADELPTIKYQWETFAQPWELGWWMTSTKRGELDDDKLIKASQQCCDGLGITEELISGKILLDVGCGPTGRLQAVAKYKNGGVWYAIDPLADRYSIDVANASVKWYDTLLPYPAERCINELVGEIDVLISINALDHGYDLPVMMRNLYSYVKDGGKAIISFDCFEQGHVDFTHPIRVSRDYATGVIEGVGFKITEQNSKPIIDDKSYWGGGVHQHWWLTK